MRSRAAQFVLLSTGVMLLMLAGCGGASRRGPAGGGVAPPAGGGGEAQIRQQLQGTWELVRYETIAADGSRTPQPVSGRLSYDPSGTLSVRAQLRRQGAPFVIDYSGRAVIDPRAQRLRVEGANVPPPPGAPESAVAAVALDRARHYQLQGDLLTVSALEPGTGRPTATAVWRKTQ